MSRNDSSHHEMLRHILLVIRLMQFKIYRHLNKYIFKDNSFFLEFSFGSNPVRQKIYLASIVVLQNLKNIY